MNAQIQALSDPRPAFFDRHARTWDNDPDEVKRTLDRLEELRERLGFVSGHDVLELGCGTGRITGWLAKAVQPGRVVGADFSTAMLAAARARGLNVDFRLMDICAELLGDDSFDVVFCFNSFPHFRDQLRALSNIRGLLKTGGQLVILHLAGSAEVNEFHARLPAPVCDDRLPSRLRWPAMLAGVGLRLMSMTDEPGLFLLKAVPVAES